MRIRALFWPLPILMISAANISGCSENQLDPAPRGPLDNKIRLPPDQTPDPNDPSDPSDPRDPQQTPCPGDARAPIEGERCRCEYTSCDGSELTCACDVECYAGADCGINCMGTGPTFECTPSDGEIGEAIGDCGMLTCTEEDDLSKELECVATDCATPEVKVFDQTAPPPMTTSIEVDRKIKRTDVLVTIDSSGSMQDKQRNMACAIDAFSRELSAEAEYSVGVVSQNTTCYEDENGQMNGQIPGLIGLEDPTCEQVACSCDEAEDVAIQCSFHKAGELVTEATPGGLDLLKKIFVIGEFDDEEACGGDEDGDEASFTPIVLRTLDAIAAGRPAPALAVTTSDESADDDGQACLWVAANYAGPNYDRFRSVLVDFSPPPQTGDCHTDLINFYVYFFTTYGCDHDPDGDGTINPEVPNLNPAAACTRVYSLCDPEECDIHEGVTTGTGGSVWDIYTCPYDPFFALIGFNTSTLSTAICGIEVDDPANVSVIYAEGAMSTPVPKVESDGVNGWSYDATLGCVDFHGSWAGVEGRFRIELDAGSAPPPAPELCFEGGIEPIVSSIVVRHLGPDGELVPQSGDEGWTFDVATDCFTLHGRWATAPLVTGPFYVEYLDVNR